MYFGNLEISLYIVIFCFRLCTSTLKTDL